MLSIFINLCLLIIFILLIILLVKYRPTQENYRDKYLYKEKYRCKGKHLIPAYSPEICCLEKDGLLHCDNFKNCKCKDRRTGICKTCYPRVKKKNVY